MENRASMKKELGHFLAELEQISRKGRTDFNFALARERISRWKTRLSQYICHNVSSQESVRLNRKKAVMIARDPYTSFIETIQRYEAYIKALVEDTEKPADGSGQTPVKIKKKRKGTSKRTGPITDKSIFVVHGRDKGPKYEVTRFLEQLGLKPIILHEQASRGLTIIEKFETHSDVLYAVILLTADDVGKLDSEHVELRHRARQNVVFELGFFIGKLGRDRVCALLEDDVERPSDIEGIVYIPLDVSEGWKLPLAKELKAAGVKLDVDRVIDNINPGKDNR